MTIFFKRIQSSTQRIIPYWVAAALVSAVSILFAKTFAWSESMALNWVVATPQFAFVLVPAGMLISTGIVEFISWGAGGSGIPQLLAAVEVTRTPGALSKKLLGPKMIISKFLGSCLCVAGGGVTGREGPNLQISAGVFYLVQKIWIRLRLKFVPDLQSMVMAGGAAGLASAFNTPLGGVVFAIEELAKVHVSVIRTYTFHAVIIAGFLTQALLGNYLYFGKFELSGPTGAEIFPLIVASAIIGLLGGIFGKAIVVTLDWRIKRSRNMRFFMTFVFGLAVATLIYLYGRPSAGSGREVITNLLLQYHEPAPFSLGLVRGFGNFFTYCGGVVGGVFAPALSTGAAFGSWMGGLMPGGNVQVWVLMGMVAFLTGLTRTPFTSLVLVLEMTDTHNVILTLMLSAIIAQSAAWIIDPISFYEHMSYRIVHGKPPVNQHEENV